MTYKCGNHDLYLGFSDSRDRLLNTMLYWSEKNSKRRLIRLGASLSMETKEEGEIIDIS